jgi:hypothetical protein
VWVFILLLAIVLDYLASLVILLLIGSSLVLLADGLLFFVIFFCWLGVRRDLRLFSSYGSRLLVPATLGVDVSLHSYTRLSIIVLGFATIYFG